MSTACSLTRKSLLTFHVLAVCLAATNPCDANERRITLGNKNFTEQYIMGEMLRQLLATHGFEVTLRADLSSMAMRAGMESADIDICTEYTGTAWMIHLKRKYTPGTDNNEIYRLVRDADKRNQFLWLDPIWNNNTYGLASWPEFAEKHNASTLSDLAELFRRRDGKIETYVNFEFSARPDGLYALQDHYDFKIARSHLKTATPGVSLVALREHQADLAMVFGTDATVAKHGWHLYRDDKSVFPPYDLTPYVRKEVADRYPEVIQLVNSLVATFPGGGMPATADRIAACRAIWQKLNARVDIERKEPADVARHFLLEHGLIE